MSKKPKYSLLNKGLFWLDKYFFLIIILLVLVFFHRAFGIGFFRDDFYFLTIGKANNLKEFLNFFSPLRGSFYRPIPSEFFYFLINTFKLNRFVIHLIIFSTYFTGLYFLYQSIILLTKKRKFAQIFIFLYSISFIHVFQLYPVFVYQEICLFFFLSISFYYYLKRKYLISLLGYIGALMSKESALFFIIVLIVYEIYKFIKQKKRFVLKNYIPLVLFFLLFIIFVSIYKFGIAKVVEIELYKIQWNPRLIINNLMWYALWGLGLPTYLPDYMTSIFQRPLPDFYKTFASLEVRIYYYLLVVYFFSFIIALFYVFFTNKRARISVIILSFFSLFFFWLFLFLTLPIIHKWMIRLTIPLIFLHLFQSYIMFLLLKGKDFAKFLAVYLLLLYFGWNYFGTVVHESASTYMLENRISNNVNQYLSKHHNKIKQHDYIFFRDQKGGKINPWGGSKKLKITLWGQYFIAYYFPEKKIVVLYDFEVDKIPKNAYVIKTLPLLIK